MPNREMPQKQNSSMPKSDVPPKFSEDTHKKYHSDQSGQLPDEEFQADSNWPEEDESSAQNASQRNPPGATEADRSLRGSKVNQAKTGSRQQPEEDDDLTEFERTGRESLIDENSSERRSKKSTH
ncbi:hypothetical protein DOM22_10740 [Bdellovibrio sp. ZAP7]|uniref:hypothetical protein n=1 Tax=Bdellovibrio sp. ZAP7 TaxID=2231053 RepID=UPI001157E297|nr:hypothetical protein [Bdellovibrio sp. ZAP7]QDK45590.1 hypothetical protein DOM22_10740 [Bdellovibrio sp. ZAP7]